MARTNIDIDDAACAAVTRRYNLDSKQAAVNLALQLLASKPMDVDEARRMRGSGWEGDLDDARGCACCEPTGSSTVPISGLTAAPRRAVRVSASEPA